MAGARNLYVISVEYKLAKVTFINFGKVHFVLAGFLLLVVNSAMTRIPFLFRQVRNAGALGMN